MDIEVLSRSQLRTKHILLAFKEVLYQNGVYWFRCGHRKRKAIHSPIVTLIGSAILMVRELAFVLIRDKTWLTVLSDYTPTDNLWGSLASHACHLVLLLLLLFSLSYVVLLSQ